MQLLFIPEAVVRCTNINVTYVFLAKVLSNSFLLHAKLLSYFTVSFLFLLFLGFFVFLFNKSLATSNWY